MNSKSFMALSEYELLSVDGGSWLGNTLVFAGGVVCLLQGL